MSSSTETAPPAPGAFALTTKDMLDLCQLDTVALEAAFDNYRTTRADATLPHILAARDQDGRTLLHWAALNGRREHVEYLLDIVRQHRPSDAAAVIDAADDSGNTPLNLAALKGDPEICGWLLAAGADVNAPNAKGHTPLQYACSKGHADCVRVCLRAGADVTARDAYGNTALHRMAGLGRVELLRAVLAAAAAGGCNVPALLDVPNGEGDTALHVAGQDEQDAAAVLLVQSGASLTTANREERTAADVAKPGLRRKLLEERQRWERAQLPQAAE